MAKTKTNGNGSNGTETVTLRNVAEVYSTPQDGDTIAAVFNAANNAVAIGHRTFSNVPFDYKFSEGTPMTAAQAKFLSAQVIRASLGNDDYGSVDEAAAIEIRGIPAQYSLAEDAMDNIVVRMIERAGGNPGRRVDREGHVEKLLSAKAGTKLKGQDQTLVAAMSAEIEALISARKAVKGKATEAIKTVDVSSFIDDDDAA
jgi:hypothetical protein